MEKLVGYVLLEINFVFVTIVSSRWRRSGEGSFPIRLPASIVFCESAMREILRAEIAWHNYISGICNVILWNSRLKWIWEQESIIPQRGHSVVSLKLHLYLCPFFVIIIHRFEDRVGLIVCHGFYYRLLFCELFFVYIISNIYIFFFLIENHI